MKPYSPATLKAELEAAKARAAAPVTTAIVVRDPPTTPEPTTEPSDKDKKRVDAAATMFAGAAIGSQLGKVIDQKMGVRTPGIGAMFLGALSAFGGAIMKDSGDPAAAAMLTNLGVGAAAAGAAQMGAEMAERNKPDPVVLLAHETLAFEAKRGRPAHYGHDVVGLDGGAYCEDCERDLTDEEWSALKATFRTR